MEKSIYTKKELREIYQISASTLRTYLNTGVLFYKLKKNGYLKYQKVLPPKLTRIVFEHLGEP